MLSLDCVIRGGSGSKFKQPRKIICAGVRNCERWQSCIESSISLNVSIPLNESSRQNSDNDANKKFSRKGREEGRGFKHK